MSRTEYTLAYFVLLESFLESILMIQKEIVRIILFAK